jgi:hypothetical protein
MDYFNGATSTKSCPTFAKRAERQMAPPENVAEISPQERS